MYNGKKILGLVTARGGSKGLPGKNIRPFAGKPLIAWTIEQALACSYIDRLVVSTDDGEIANIAKQFGAEVPFMRPAELATDQATSMDVVFHALEFFKRLKISFDYLILLQPTSPLRGPEDISRSIELLVDNQDKADSLVSVGEITHGHPSITQKIDGNGLLQPCMEDRITSVRRQDLSKIYIPYGAVFFAKTEALQKNGTFYQERTLPYILERWQHYEIDDIYDFMAAETVFQTKY